MTSAGEAARPLITRRPPRIARQRRPISARSPLTGRQLWRVGDWGGASEQIGRRWETLGARALEAITREARPALRGLGAVTRGALVLGAEPQLAAQVQAAGRPHADAILIGAAAGGAVLQPVDFKWSLETANPSQVRAEVLASLLSDPPPLLGARLQERLGGLDGRQAVYRDGVFLAPDHPHNRAFLARSDSFAASWAVLTPVEASEFFSPLPGWDIARALAEYERADLRVLEMAERYYRLGAGLLGAFSKLKAGLFGEIGELDGVAELARIREERHLISAAEIVAYLDAKLAARRELVDRLRAIERTAYPYALFRKDLDARGVADQGPDGEHRWGRLYGVIMKALSCQVRGEGRELVALGRTECQARAELEGRRADWTCLARWRLNRQLACNQSGFVPS